MKREIELKRIEEKIGEERRMVLIVELEEEKEREEILGMREVFWRKFRASVDEDLSMKERRIRWRIIEKAREERRKGKKVRVTNIICTDCHFLL